jgi:SAM-dependent methyltransferase
MLKQLGFLIDFQRFAVLGRQTVRRFPLRWSDRYPCLDDRTALTGFDRHYVFHPAWAARIVRELSPRKHVDIGSSLHFCTVLSAFVPTQFYDYRPANLGLDNLISDRADLTALPFPDDSVECLSCMHVVEHVGLGRYGDPLDYDGDRKAMSELARVLAPGGTLLFVVPTGRPRVQFNAHRIYSTAQIEAEFSALDLKEFALIPDRSEDGGLIRHAPTSLAADQAYGCGCYRFEKPRGA